MRPDSAAQVLTGERPDPAEAAIGVGRSETSATLPQFGRAATVLTLPEASRLFSLKVPQLPRNRNEKRLMIDWRTTKLMLA